MKTSKYIMVMALCAGFASCTTEDEVEPVNNGVVVSTTIKEISVTMPVMEAGTRTEFDISESSVRAAWAEGDVIGIFPSSGGQVEFPTVSGAGSNVAKFDGGGWGLKDAYSYAAYFPYNKDNVYRDHKTILLDYTGQTQTGNDNYDHLGAYDYLASGTVTPVDGYLNFDLQRLGSLLRIEVTAPRTATYTQLTLTSDNAEFVTKAELDISGEQPQVNVTETAKSITLGLEDISLTEGEQLTAYLMVSPVDLSSSTLNVTLKSTFGSYVAGLDSKNLEASKPYKFAAADLTGILTNQHLISAAEQSVGRNFERNDDGTVSLSNATNQEIVNSVTELNLFNLNDPTVADELGHFANLRWLDIRLNNIESLDFSSNTALETIFCGGCINEDVYVYDKLAKLNVSNNASLVNLYVYCAELTTLDVSNNVLLRDLQCEHNKIASLNVNNCPDLVVLVCGGNRLTSIDLTNNIELVHLNIYGDFGDPEGNLLSSLDISANTKLDFIEAGGNYLTSIDLSNKPNLWYISLGRNYFEEIDVSDCLNLQSLNLEKCNLTNIDVSNNLKLKDLLCSDNSLRTIDLSNNKELTRLQALGCGLTSIDVSNNTELQLLDLGANELTSIDVSNNRKLTYFSTGTNPIANVDISNCTELDNFICDNDLVTSIDISHNMKLNCIRANSSRLTSLDISGHPNLSLNNVYIGDQRDEDGNSREMTLYVSKAQYSSGSLPMDDDFYRNDNVNIIVVSGEGDGTATNPGFGEGWN